MTQGRALSIEGTAERHRFDKICKFVRMAPMKNDRELKIVDASTRLFYQHGFKRVTMNDIAEAVGISRPLLYQLYANKEDIFTAVIRIRGARTVESIRAAVAAQTSVQAQLLAAFELWCVAPFELLQQQPAAKDIIECGHGFARDTLAELTTAIEDILTGALLDAGFPAPDEARTAARVLLAASGGFKQVAHSGAELRALLTSQIDFLLRALASA